MSQVRGVPLWLVVLSEAAVRHLPPPPPLSLFCCCCCYILPGESSYLLPREKTKKNVSGLPRAPEGPGRAPRPIRVFGRASRVGIAFSRKAPVRREKLGKNTKLSQTYVHAYDTRYVINVAKQLESERFCEFSGFSVAPENSREPRWSFWLKACDMIRWCAVPRRTHTCSRPFSSILLREFVATPTAV